MNEYGCMVREEWFRSVEIRSEIKLFADGFVVMPNHIYGIVWITHGVGATGRSPLRLKSAVARRINALRGTPGAPVWPRNDSKHIIRTERAMHAIRRYIVEKPLRWHFYRYNSKATGTDPPACNVWRIFQDDARMTRTQTTCGVAPGDPEITS